MSNILRTRKGGFMNKKISDHFSEEEMQCPCCEALIYDPELIKAAERLRGYLNKSMIVTSGYRCKDHDTKISGVSGVHCTGKAMDFYVPKMSNREVWEAIETSCPGVFQGVGSYPDTNNQVIHIDIWEKRWSRWVCIGNKPRIYFPLFNRGQWEKMKNA